LGGVWEVRKGGLRNERRRSNQDSFTFCWFAIFKCI